MDRRILPPSKLSCFSSGSSRSSSTAAVVAVDTNNGFSLRSHTSVRASVHSTRRHSKATLASENHCSWSHFRSLWGTSVASTSTSAAAAVSELQEFVESFVTMHSSKRETRMDRVREYIDQSSLPISDDESGEDQATRPLLQLPCAAISFLAKEVDASRTDYYINTQQKGTHFPSEILLAWILPSLDTSSVIACRKVCQHWRKEAQEFQRAQCLCLMPTEQGGRDVVRGMVDVDSPMTPPNLPQCSPPATNATAAATAAGCTASGVPLNWSKVGQVPAKIRLSQRARRRTYFECGCYDFDRGKFLLSSSLLPH